MKLNTKMKIAGDYLMELERKKSRVTKTKTKREETKMARGGYKQSNPPEDDCCPICFDSFSVPCKTNCGHWYCASCILRYWRHGHTRFCHCPTCGSEITKLQPHTSSLNQTGEDKPEILEDVKQYNRLWITLLWAVLKHTYAIPSFSLMRRRFRETLDFEVIKPARGVARFISLMIVVIYALCGFDFPFEIADAENEFIWMVVGILLWSQLCIIATYVFFLLDAAWYEISGAHARRQAEVGR